MRLHQPLKLCNSLHPSFIADPCERGTIPEKKIQDLTSAAPYVHALASLPHLSPAPCTSQEYAHLPVSR